MKYLILICLILLTLNQIQGQTVNPSTDCGVTITAEATTTITGVAATTFADIVTCLGQFNNLTTTQTLTLDLSASTALGDPTTLDLSGLTAVTTATINVSNSGLTGAHLAGFADKVKLFRDAATSMTDLTLTLKAASSDNNVANDAAVFTAIDTITALTFSGGLTITFNPFDIACTDLTAGDSANSCKTITLTLAECTADLALAIDVTLDATAQSDFTSTNTCLGRLGTALTTLDLDVSGYTGDHTVPLTIPAVTTLDNLANLTLNVGNSNIDQDALEAILTYLTNSKTVITTTSLTLKAASDNNTFDNVTPIYTYVKESGLTAASATIDGCTNPLTQASTNIDDCTSTFTPEILEIDGSSIENCIGSYEISVVAEPKNTIVDWSSATAGSFVVTPPSGTPDAAVTGTTLDVDTDTTTTTGDYSVVYTATIGGSQVAAPAFVYTVSTTAGCPIQADITPSTNLEVCKDITFDVSPVAATNPNSETVSNVAWNFYTQGTTTNAIPAASTSDVDLSLTTLTIPADVFADADVATFTVKATITMSGGSTVVEQDDVTLVVCVPGGDDDDDDTTTDSSNILSLTLACVALLFVLL